MTDAHWTPHDDGYVLHLGDDILCVAPNRKEGWDWRAYGADDEDIVSGWDVTLEAARANAMMWYKRERHDRGHVADDRAAVAAWLRAKAQCHDVDGHDPAAMMFHYGAACALADAANAIERGDHLRGEE